jgi:hypothetical protein
MLRTMVDMTGCSVMALGGRIGRLRDFYFDDFAWIVCYLVADIGSWHKGRNVLVAPRHVFELPRGEVRQLELTLSTDEIKRCPGIESDLPVSLREKIEVGRYPVWSPLVPPMGIPVDLASCTPAGKGTAGKKEGSGGDPHLRSLREVVNYRLQTAEGERFGHVAEFIMDTEGWFIRYMVVDTRYWLPGKLVLIAPSCVKEIDWPNALVHVDMKADKVKSLPEFDPSAPVNREYEARLYDFYGRLAYWK